MLSAFQYFGHQGDLSDFELSGGATTPANGYITEDGTQFYITEDGLSYYVQES